MRFPLQGAVLLETSHISLDDRFAALQIVVVADSSPPYRLLTVVFPFHLQFTIVLCFEIVLWRIVYQNSGGAG